MKRLSILLMLVALISVSAFAQTSRNSYVQQNLGLAKKSLLGDSRPTVCDTFINLCVDDTLVIYTASCTGNIPGGYVCGHNCYGDLAKADIFFLPGQAGNTTVKGCLIFFGVGKAANTKDQFNVRMYDNDGLFADGGAGAPGTILATKTVKYNQVKTDVTAGNLTAVTFATPVAFPADSIFYMGIDYTYKAGDTVALVNVLDRTGSGLSCSDANTSVDKFSDGTWHRFTDPDDWGLATSQMFLPILCSASCSVTITPGSASICKTKSVNLTASGATTYTWSPATGLNVTTGATVTAKPTATTTYTVKGDGGSCSNTVKVTVTTNPTATVTAGPCTNHSVLLTRNGTPTTGITLQWFKGNTAIAGATNSTFTATQTASYKVKVTITATGCNKTSPAVSVTINCKTADEDAMSFTADAFPNPFVNSVTVNISSASSEVANVKLMDFSGRIVREYKNVDVSAPFEIKENLAPGVYFVRVNQGTNEKMIKVVKE